MTSDLKQSCVCRLFVVLLGRMLPRDPEHVLLLIFPAQAFILAALYLLDQPLFHAHFGPWFHLHLRR